MAHGSRTRYDYRNDYKDYSLTELKNALDKAKDKLIFWIGVNVHEERDAFKRVAI